MYRTVPYIVLFLILALLQIFLFDNLSISIYLCPLVYIGFIVLLPGSGDQYDRYASGRYAAPAASAVCLR